MNTTNSFSSVCAATTNVLHRIVDWTFFPEALKYKESGAHWICHVCRLCHSSAVLPDFAWLPSYQASFFCQKRFLERYWEAGLLCSISSFDLPFRCKSEPTNRPVQLLFWLISISAMSIAVITAWLANFLIKESQWTKWSIFHCGFRFNTYIGFAICSTLFGDKGIAYLSLLIACWVPISNVIATVGLVHASRVSGSQNSGKRKNFLVAVFSNPLILATLLGSRLQLVQYRTS